MCYYGSTVETDLQRAESYLSGIEVVLVEFHRIVGVHSDVGSLQEGQGKTVNKSAPQPVRQIEGVKRTQCCAFICIAKVGGIALMSSLLPEPKCTVSFRMTIGDCISGQQQSGQVQILAQDLHR